MTLNLEKTEIDLIVPSKVDLGIGYNENYWLNEISKVCLLHVSANNTFKREISGADD